MVGAGVRFRLLLIPAAAVLLLLGGARVSRMPADVLPETSAPKVEIQAESLGLSAAEVEQLITVPMEQYLLNGVRGAQAIHSDSIPGTARIELEFPRGTNVLEARQLVQERLTQTAALPNVATPPQMLQPVSTSSRVMMIGLSSRRLSLTQLSVLARWTIRPKLLGLPGVANVAVWGQRDRQLQVLVDPQRLRARHVTLPQVVSTTGNAQLVSPLSYLGASTPGTGGFIDGPNQRLSVRHVLPFGAPSALAAVPVEGTHGERLGRVATVVEGHQPLNGDAWVGGGPGLLLAIDKRPGAGAAEVAHRVDRALDALRPGLSGVRMDTGVFRPATFVSHGLNRLYLAGLLAALLAGLGLAAFLRAGRQVLVVLVVAAASLGLTLVLLALLHQTMNALLVAGLLLAVGAVLEDAITIALLTSRRSVLESFSAAGGSLVSGGVISLLAVLPLLVSSGLSAAFVRPLALTYALAGLVSMALTLTLGPALCSLLLARERATPGRRPSLMRRLAGRYEARLARVVSSPRRVLIPAAALGAVGLLALFLTGQPGRPSFHDPDVVVRLEGAPGASLTRTAAIARRAIERLGTVPGVGGADADLGRAVTSDRVVGTSSAELWLHLKNNAGYGATMAGVRRAVSGLSGTRGQVTTYEADRTAGVLAGADHSVTARVYGGDYGRLRDRAGIVAEAMSKIDGARNVHLEGVPVMQPTVQVQVDLAAALRHDLKPGDVRRAVGTLVSGLTVGNFFEQQKVFDVVVRGVSATREGVNAVRNLLIDTPRGGHVRLREVANVRVRPDPVDIRHDAVSRYVDVSADVDPGDLARVRNEAQQQLRAMAFPLDYHAEVLGTGADGGTSRGRFVTYLVAALLGALLVLQAASGSWAISALVMASAPLAAAGGLLAALIFGRGGSLGALAALIGLVVLAVRQSLPLLGDGSEMPLLERARERFPAVIATNAAIGLAMLPFLFMSDVLGGDITQPIALTTLCGLVTVTAFTLFVVPAIVTTGADRAAQPAPGPS
jgi:multidrug efflux pump subunit AcrB